MPGYNAEVSLVLKNSITSAFTGQRSGYKEDPYCMELISEEYKEMHVHISVNVIWGRILFFSDFWLT